MQLLAWSYPCSAGFNLTGWRSVPSGKPLLHVLHGNGFCGLTYEPMLTRLAEHFDLWLCDAQGHGETEHGGQFVGWNRCAELAVEVFEAQRSLYGQVPCLALGHSFGGVLTGLMMAQHPHLFERAVLLDPVIFLPKMLLTMKLLSWLGLNRHVEVARKTAARRSQWPDRASAYSQLQGRGVFRGWHPEALQAYVDHAIGECVGGVELKCRPSREVDIFSSTPQRLWSSLTRVVTPSLLLYGDKTYPFVRQAAKRLAQRNSHIQIAQVVGGHCFMQEQPRETADRVTTFLRAQV